MLLVTSLTCATDTVPLQLSLVVTDAVFGAGTFDAQTTVTGAGHEMNGTTLSLTVIIWAHVAVLPQTSVALYVLVTVYLLMQALFDVTSLTKLMLTVPVQLSVAVTASVCTPGTFDAQTTVTFAGQVITGGVKSRTVIVC
jgi:hypothetical protein